MSTLKTAVARANSAALPAKKAVAPTALLNVTPGTAPIAKSLPRDGARPPFFGLAAAALKATAAPAAKKATTAPSTADPAQIEYQREYARRYGLPGQRLINFYDDKGIRNTEKFQKLTTVDLAVVPQYQGKYNACGTTSMAAMFDYWNPGKTGNDHFTIDKSIRSVDTFTAPDDLVKYAEANGYRAAMKNDASLDDIQKMLDQGVPVQVIMEPLNPGDATGKTDRGDFGIHYVTVTGYEKGPDGKISKVSVTDPWGMHYTLSAADFLDRWSNLKVGHTPTGLNRVMITYVPDDGRTIVGPDGKARKASDIELPSNDLLGTVFNDANAGRGLTQGIMNVLNGFTQGNPLKVIVGANQTLLSVGPMAGTILGSWAKEGGQIAMDWGKQQLKMKDLGSKIVGGAAVVGGAIAYGAGWLATKSSSGVAFVVNKVAEVGTKVAEAVGSAVGSAAKAVGKTVKKIFSGW